MPTAAIATCQRCGYSWQFGWEETCPNCGREKVSEPKRVRIPKASPGEDTLWLALRGAKLPFEREYRFDPRRKWRVDFACVVLKIAVEVEGGIWSDGRHTRGGGYEKDAEKYNALSAAGWTVLRFTTKQACDGSALTEIEEAVKKKMVDK